MKMKSKSMYSRSTQTLSAIALASVAVVHLAARASAVDEGRKIYQNTCAMCHGAELNASGGIPDLRKSKLDDDSFLQTVRNGRAGTIMPSMKERLSDDDIRKVRAYIKASS